MIAKKIHRKNLTGILFILILIISSCSTPLREVTYLNGIRPNLIYINGPAPEVYLIRPNDQLFIQVISDDPLLSAFLNLSQNTGRTNSSSEYEIITFLVDENGNIEYPYLGQIKVGGLTVSDVNIKIKKMVDNYLENASVFVKLVNRNITVLGEVNSPGQILMVKNQLTIFEALGAAGDITDYGNRKNVKVMRELPLGKQIIKLDLTDPKLIYSPFYYILPHDIIYVEHNTKVYGAKNMSYSAPISVVASLLSLVFLSFNLMKK